MKYLLNSILCFLLFSCNSISNKEHIKFFIESSTENLKQDTTKQDSVSAPVIFIENNRFDFGEIESDEISAITIEFELVNIGTSPLVIIKGDVSCKSCLTVDYTKKPIFTNEKATIIIKVDPGSIQGIFNKTVFIKSNAKNDVILLRITGKIK